MKLLSKGTLSLCCLILLFFYSCESPRDRRVEPAPFTENTFKFDVPREVENPIEPYQGFLVVLILVALTIGVYRYYQRTIKGKKEDIQNTYYHRQFENVSKQLHLSQREKGFLLYLARTKTDFKKVLSIVNDNYAFEEVVQQAKAEESNPQFLFQLFHLRYRLGFDFHNRRIPFICTQMLPVGTKVDCWITIENANHHFTSTVLWSTETHLFLRPPMKEHRALAFPEVAKIMCVIRRGWSQDEYFQLSYIQQISGAMDALVMKHTNHIQELPVKNAKKIELEMKMTFYIATDQYFVSFPQKRVHLHTEELPAIEGKIIDLSLGGANIMIASLPKDIYLSDLIVFTLPFVQETPMIARIVYLEPQREETELQVRFLSLQPVEREKLAQFLREYRPYSLASKSQITMD